MTALLWDDVLADVRPSTTHFRHAVDMFDEGLAPGDSRPRDAAVMAFQHAMQAGYASFESGMKRLLALLDEPFRWDRIRTRPFCGASAAPRTAPGQLCSIPNCWHSFPNCGGSGTSPGTPTTISNPVGPRVR